MLKSDSFVQFLDEPSSERILTLEKNIIFLKSQHQEMLLALHNEIENLKEKNIDLQRILFLSHETSFITNKTEENQNGNDINPTTTIVELQKKISLLQEQLRIAQDTNKRLETELESKTRPPSTAKHKVVKSQVPVVQQAEQVKTKNLISDQLRENVNYFDTHSEFPNPSTERLITGITYSHVSPTRTQNLPNRISHLEKSESQIASNVASTEVDAFLHSSQLSFQSNAIKLNSGDHVDRAPHHRPVSNCEMIGSGTRLVPLKKHSVPKRRNEDTSAISVHCAHLPTLKSHILQANTNVDLLPSRMFASSTCGPKNSVGDCVPPRAPHGLLMRSASGRIELQHQKKLMSPKSNHERSHEKPFITLPAIKNTFDVNKAALKRKSLELQKNHLSQCRDRYLF